jgi:4-hydroxy-3-methylbut-2-enyl diphosphate reductase
MQNFKEIVGDIALRTKELKVVNTLCPAITVRQEEAEVMVGQVDALVVVGGHHSSNTTRLAEISRERGLPTHHIETHDELDPVWFSGVRRVGVMSGASTPDWIIAEVVRRLQEIGAGVEARTTPAAS